MSSTELYTGSKGWNEYFVSSFFCVVFCTFFFHAINLSALSVAKDSLKQIYSLNDPRNPNCPCHKYQKRADEEFRKMKEAATRELVLEKKISKGTEMQVKRKTSYLMRVYSLRFKTLKRQAIVHTKFKTSFFKLYSKSKIVACPKW